MRRGKTLWSNVLTGATGAAQEHRRLLRAHQGLQARGRDQRLRVVDVPLRQDAPAADPLDRQHADHQPLHARARDPRGRPRPSSSSRKAFVKGKLPFCDHYFITTFFRPPIRKDRHQPLPADPAAGDPRGEAPRRASTCSSTRPPRATTRSPTALAASGLECRIYGMRRDIKEEQVEGNLRYRPFSEAGFIDDLASARGVIAGGGFTLMGEAVYLHKPMLAVPLEHAVRAGAQRALPRAPRLREVRRRPRRRRADPRVPRGHPGLRRKLAAYSQDGNQELLGAVDEQLDRAAARVL